uniref:glutamine--fructose-6-phosphate transaminase (isomerizing) n=1 Tax=Chlamydomonas euryale TaxID=1486919 RepID=A0A7R9V3S4_9CHLO
MCGIFGYYVFNVNRDIKAVLEALFNGLRRLEYRGYDSAGIAIDLVDAYPLLQLRNADDPYGLILEENGDHGCTAPLVIKEVGKVAQLEKLVSETLSSSNIDTSRVFKSHVGIAHTRWATHGSPSAINSHPHVSDPDAEFTVVHNGIITNYKLLKDFLINHGETFVSETDTEVIPKLCRFVYKRLKDKVPFPKLVFEVLKKLEGAYAVLVKSTHYPGELVACKRGSPMIMGIKEHKEGLAVRRSSFANIRDADDTKWRSESIEVFVASDPAAVLEHTKRVIVLEDNDVLHVTGGGYGIYNTGGQDVDEAVPRVLQTLQMEVEQIMKGGYEHYMQKEIHEQPESLLQTMSGRVLFQRKAVGDPYLSQRIKLGGFVETAQMIRNARRMMFVACGTSYHACLAARQTMEELCDLPVVLELASDLLDRRCPIFRDDCCVFVSQSGETADTLLALEYAKSRGALCVGITNTVGSAISRSTHCGMHLNAGYEIGVASTKAYTSMILSITMIALQLSEDSISKRETRDRIIDELGQLPGKVRAALMLDSAMRELAETLKDEHSLMFFARGRNYATALEAALKTKEVALIHSEGILAGEMKHGPLALVDEKLPIILFATKDTMHKKMDSVIQQLLARAASLCIVCNTGDQGMMAYADQGCRIIQVPETVDALQPVVNVIPMQLLSYHLTLLRGHNVDQPRNLAKAVTTSEEH